MLLRTLVNILPPQLKFQDPSLKTPLTEQEQKANQ